MDMNQPVGHNALDDNRQGLMGKPIDRVDGRLKVMGKAPYAYEVHEGGKAAYGFIVDSTIAKGMVADIDTATAERAPGVLMVMTYRNAPKQAPWGPVDAKDRFARAKPQLVDAKVEHYGQPVAFVVAESFEEARAAAALVKVRYAQEKGEYELVPNKDKAEKPKDTAEKKSDMAVGDFEGAFASAAVKIDSTFTTPTYIHAQMEPHASLAFWQGDHVTVHCSAQLLESAQDCVANTLQIPKENVRIVGRYVGGGFGGKLPIFADAILSALASRQLGRPVKTALTRQQMFHVATHRTQTVQRVRLGASADGRIVAIGHQNWSHSARFDNFYETSGHQTLSLYQTPNMLVEHRMLKLDLPVSDSTRAPGEAVGMLALEQAMDELAERLGIDPVALRLRNEPENDPSKKIPYSSRHLVQCLEEGSRRFGWGQRKATPAQVREGRWMIGMGVASASRGNQLRPSKAKVSIDAQGVVTARMSMTDIGTGSYTVLSQIAAEMMGVPVEKVRMLIGDSDFPPTAGSGGSFGAASSGSALFDACTNLRAKLAEKAGIEPRQAIFRGSRVTGGGTAATLMSLVGSTPMEAEGEVKPGSMEKQFSQQAYGAHFAEVAVDMDTGEIRVRRMLGVFAAGRILNMKLATSQAYGGMVWGISNALHEDAVLDPRTGHFANHDLAEYHVAAHADVPSIEVHYLTEIDDKTNPLKIKGVGELGICGAGAAIANAVYNACGVRIRDYPLTLDKVMSGMGAAKAA